VEVVPPENWKPEVMSLVKFNFLTADNEYLNEVVIKNEKEWNKNVGPVLL
jgi:hypothetical protein